MANFTFIFFYLLISRLCPCSVFSLPSRSLYFSFFYSSLSIHSYFLASYWQFKPWPINKWNLYSPSHCKTGPRVWVVPGCCVWFSDKRRHHNCTTQFCRLFQRLSTEFCIFCLCYIATRCVTILRFRNSYQSILQATWIPLYCITRHAMCV